MKSIYLIAILFLFACGNSQQTQSTTKDTAAPKALPATQAADTASQAEDDNVKVHVKTFENKTDDEANGTWGYDIYLDTASSPYIHQPSIPGVPGIKGFQTEIEASAVGELVKNKIKHHITPPSVTEEELDRLRILK